MEQVIGSERRGTSIESPSYLIQVSLGFAPFQEASPGVGSLKYSRS